MADKFGRICEVICTNRLTGRQFRTSSLRVDFTVTKTQKAGDNKAKVTVYNFSQSTRGLVAVPNDSSGQGQVGLELRCGYGNEKDLITIFKGKGSAESSYAAPDWKTTFDITDGLQEIKRAVVQKTYPAGTSVKQIFSDLFSAAGIEKVIDVSITSIIPKSRTISGDPLKEAEELAETYGLKWDIQDEQGILNTNDNNAPTQVYRLPLDRGSGMLNQPRIKGDLVIVEALIDGNYKPGNYLQIVSTKNPSLDGIYEIKRVDMKGSNFGGNWVASMECVRKNFVPIYQNLTSIDGVIA